MKNYLLLLLLAGGAIVSNVICAQQLPETNNKVHYTEQSVQKAMNSIYRKIKAGADFSQLARQYSQDYGSYSMGGNLGWQKLDQFLPVFTASVNQLRKNQYSEPFKSEFGYHIVQLLDKKEGEVLVRHILLRVNS